MKRILLIVCCLCVLPPHSTAEVYECNGVYQTTPCEGGGGLLKDLPKISRAEGQSLADMRKEILQLKKKSSELRSSLSQLKRCERVTSGLPFRLIYKKLYLEEKSITFKGMIRNYSDKPVETPIAAGLREGQSKEHTERIIVKELGPGKHRDFSLQMPPPMVGNPQFEITIGQTTGTYCLSLPLNLEFLPEELAEDIRRTKINELYEQIQKEYTVNSRSLYDEEFSKVCFRYATLAPELRTTCARINMLLEKPPA